MARSSRARYLLFALVSVLLSATAIVIVLQGPSSSPEDAGAERKRPTPALSAADRREAARRAASLQAGGEDLHDDESRPPPGLEPAGRRFLRFYLPYEVGKTTPAVTAGLQASASPEFADELLVRAPRVPPGVSRKPAEAQLLGIDAFALDGNPGAGQIVAKFRRDGGLEAGAFELHRVAGRWLVTGVAG
jgi:hypothetical protein